MLCEIAAGQLTTELTERIEETDPRLAASAQVFDEARHFYALLAEGTATVAFRFIADQNVEPVLSE